MLPRQAPEQGAPARLSGGLVVTGCSCVTLSSAPLPRLSPRCALLLRTPVYGLCTCAGISSPEQTVSAVQPLSYAQPFANPWTAARQASLSFTISWSLLKLMSIESVMPSNHLILCHPLLLPSIFPSIRVFSNESALPIRWPKY